MISVIDTRSAKKLPNSHDGHYLVTAFPTSETGMPEILNHLQCGESVQSAKNHTENGIFTGFEP